MGRKKKDSLQSAVDSICEFVEFVDKERLRAQVRKLERQQREYDTAAKAAKAPLVYEYDSWELPAIDGNLRYHTKWGNDDVGNYATVTMDTLDRFNLPCQFAGVRQGPSVNCFEFRPVGKTKVRSILNLEDDFKVALRNSNTAIRVDGGTLLVEVPRISRETVYFGDLVRNDVFQGASKTSLTIGMDNELNPIIIDLRKAVHILIAGQTGSGKSVFMHTLVLSMLMKNTPTDLHMHIIDPKMLEFSRYKSLPLCTVTTEVQDAVALLADMCTEMDRRYKVLAAAGSRDIDSYNVTHADAPMRREVVIIDELADLMSKCKKDVESNIARLAQKARACGIHLIIATQYPVRTVVTGVIKQNMLTRICLSVKDAIASKVALDQTGAENLLGNGDMLFLMNGALEPVRLQGGFVDEDEINNIVYSLQNNIISVHREGKQSKSSNQSVYGALSAICGSIGCLLWHSPVFAVVFALAGLVYGFKGLANVNEHKPLSSVGLVCSIIAAVIPLAV